jgi:superoxide dismutase, Fe-Mn family
MSSANQSTTIHPTSVAVEADPKHLNAAVLIDVRRAAVFEKATTMIPHAIWRDPAKVSEWATDLPVGKPVVVYCVYGHEVSQTAAIALQARGIDARFLAGGIDAWQTAGHTVVAKTPA